MYEVLSSHASLMKFLEIFQSPLKFPEVCQARWKQPRGNNEDFSHEVLLSLESLVKSPEVS